MKPSRPWTPYLFLLGPFAVFGFAVLAPMAMTVYYSLLDWNGYGAQTFIGLDNFKELMGDTLFRDSFKHVLLYIGATLVVEVAVGLLLAALATSGRGTRLWFRTAVFTPVMLPMVVVALLWGFIYNPDFGLANAGLDALGLGDWARAWLGDPDTALWAICVVSGWAFAGFYMTIFAASLASLPQDIIEAARLDGAGGAAVLVGQAADGPQLGRGVGAAVRDRRVPRLRPVLCPHQRRSLPRDRDPDDLSGA